MDAGALRRVFLLHIDLPRAALEPPPLICGGQGRGKNLLRSQPPADLQIGCGCLVALLLI